MTAVPGASSSRSIRFASRASSVTRPSSCCVAEARGSSVLRLALRAPGLLVGIVMLGIAHRLLLLLASLLRLLLLVLARFGIVVHRSPPRGRLRVSFRNQHS